MAELEIQEYEQLNRNVETTYDEIKVDKRTIEMKHLVILSWNQFFKNVLLVLMVSLFSAGVVSTVTYFTICAKLQQKFDLIKIELENINRKLADIEIKLSDIEKKNKTKLQEKENRNMDNYTMCYSGETWQRLNDSTKCVCAAGFLDKQCKYSDGKDTSFMVVFHEGYQDVPLMPRILVASANTARLSVLYFSNNTNHSITIDKSNTAYNLSNSVLPSDGIHLAGVELHSDVGINVYGFLYGGRVSEGYLLMPVKFASTKYIISTLPTFIIGYGFRNLLVLSPIYQNTAVSINLKLESGSVAYESKQYNNNDTIRIVINKYNTFQLSHTSDLSGTLVTASKPVIVVSGNQCNFAVPDNIRVGYCQPFIESVLPTNQLDNLYITPHLSKRLNNTVRIQAANSTKLTIKVGNRKISKTLNARDYWDFYYNTTAFIFASDDIFVMSYPHGLIKHKGDPFMMTIPGVNQYLYEYNFVVPTGFESFISITVQSDALEGFLLDGNSSYIKSLFSISEGMNHYSTFSLHISAGYHHIDHKKKVRFGLWVYGNKYPDDGYGYPAGMAYKT